MRRVILEKEVQHPLKEWSWSKVLLAGETLFWQGDSPTCIYQVVDGFVKLTRTSPCGRETIAELLLPGDVFDLPSCMDGSPYPFTCKAPSNGSARVSVSSCGLLMEDPQLNWYCQAQLIRQLRRQRSNPVACPADRVEVRLSRALLYLAECLGQCQDGVVSFTLQLTRQELAEWIGTSTETVIRLCSEWKRQGLIEWNRQRLKLLIPQQLSFLSDVA